MPTTGERLIKSAHEAAAMATEQQTIEAVAVAIYNSSKHLELYQLDEESRNWAMLHARNNAKAAIETLKSLGWQRSCSVCNLQGHCIITPSNNKKSPHSN